jgi:hypothetical protein
LVLNHLFCREISRDFTTRCADLIRNECDYRNLGQSPYASTQKMHRSRSRSALHFDNGNIYQIRMEKQFPSAGRHGLLPAEMLERWPSVCRDKISFRLLPTNSFVSTTMNSMKCRVNWIPLRIRVRSRNAKPHLKPKPERKKKG